MAKKFSQLIGLSTDARVELYLIRMAFEELESVRVVEMATRWGFGGMVWQFLVCVNGGVCMDRWEKHQWNGTYWMNK